MRPSFLALPRPFLCAITYEANAGDTEANIRMAEHDGSQAFMVDMTRFPESDLCEERLRQMFRVTGRPCMPLLYRSNNLKDITDEERCELMKRCIKAGAAGVDVMGDLFDPARDERTLSPEAVEKQKALIREIHDMGAEVLISSHTNRVMTCKEIVTHMLDVEARGADIVKIVTVADTKAQLIDSFAATAELSERLKVPFVQLVGGHYARLQRYVVPYLGACLTFGVQAYTPLSMGPQPLISSAREVMRELSWATEYPQD